ncbi:hypothetical protein ACLGD5_06440 [Helicobacter pylori]
MFWNSTPTNNAQEITAKIKIFHFVMKHPNTRDIWDFCLGGFKGGFLSFLPLALHKSQAKIK